ncbi:MAG: ABC transporter ATP-binding protein [Hyphomonadaceae bacterium]|nr:MAG: lipopolysaccharide transport system ATP-binding protein [Caulobacteraceae bacterium]MBT9445057.1 ABC transporter ATP-binding protein [Hyphomonadaceae bacterium]TPW08936.1 MAG: lipopolysaccharide transport system ATP-binding protein [Alphaproteobacteria bacterium]
MSSNVVSTGPRIIIRRAQLDYPLVRDQSSIKSAVFGALGFRTGPRIDKKAVHAVNGLSLTINRGERVGLIGHNGAGKSTLLRTIAGIYPLTDGSIEVTGRMQGLFDLGTGFESEATGRENIMFRGLSIGFSPRQIRERAEEIIAFADLGEFIDLPMRTYSAGMYVRLGFAVSTYLEGDILLVDEVFGAGDANFQERAIRRMNDLIDRAGILMLVGHDLALMCSVCTRLVWLSGGQMVLDGDPREVAEVYIRSMRAA